MAILELEFKALLDNALDQVKKKVGSGELTESEAEDLVMMLDSCRYSWREHMPDGRCPEGHDPGCGWSSSMGYHCD